MGFLSFPFPLGKPGNHSGASAGPAGVAEVVNVEDLDPFTEEFAATALVSACSFQGPEPPFVLEVAVRRKIDAFA